MVVDCAQRLADCPEITDEQLEAMLEYLSSKLNREREETRVILMITVRSKRLVEESLRTRGYGQSPRPETPLL